jgi:acyl dehydratase
MRMGYDGKLTLHPDQIVGAHRAFAPSAEEMDEAERIVSMWEEGRGGGGDDREIGRRGSMEHDGKMIDLPHYVRAKKVVARGSGVAGRRRDDGGVERRRDDVHVAPKNGGATSYATAPGGGGRQEEEGGEGAGGIFPRVFLGKYFEELHPGTRMRHYLTRTVTESDNVFFTCLTLNPAPIHLDHELSRENAAALAGDSSTSSASAEDAGKPLFNSMFTLALLVGMSVPECTHGTTVANLGFSEVSFPKPVYPGDTLRAETEVLDRRDSRTRPNQGIVTFRHVAYNQRGEEVCRATRQALMKRRP